VQRNLAGLIRGIKTPFAETTSSVEIIIISHIDMKGETFFDFAQFLASL
jgi:hypothetical protein